MILEDCRLGNVAKACCRTLYRVVQKTLLSSMRKVPFWLMWCGKVKRENSNMLELFFAHSVDVEDVRENWESFCNSKKGLFPCCIIIFYAVLSTFNIHCSFFYTTFICKIALQVALFSPLQWIPGSSGQTLLVWLGVMTTLVMTKKAPFSAGGTFCRNMIRFKIP